MNISSLEKMETIVANNKSLNWEGWTVIESKADQSAWMKKDAAFIEDKWYRINRYDSGPNGWNIPDRLIK
jgi:hypothetical protein